MIRAASPVACPPVAHAVTGAKLGPFAPVRIGTIPAAVLTMIMGTKNGLTRLGPRSRRMVSWLSQVSAPPIPDPIRIPTCAPFWGVMVKRASSRASRVAPYANCTKRSLRRTSFFSKNAAGSKSRTSAAILVSNPEASKRVINPTPLRPSIRLAQKRSLPMPMGLITPTPVTTTRRRVIIGAWRVRPGPPLLLSGGFTHVGLDILHRLAHRGNLLGILVRDFDAKFFLQSHDEFDHVERIGPEIVHKRGLRGDFIDCDPELFHNDVLDAFEDGCHRTSHPRASLPHRRYHTPAHPKNSPERIFWGPEPRQRMTNPPSTFRTCPVMYDASSEARKTTAAATSSGFPARPNGTCSRRTFTWSGVSRSVIPASM